MGHPHSSPPVTASASVSPHCASAEAVKEHGAGTWETGSPLTGCGLALGRGLHFHDSEVGRPLPGSAYRVLGSYQATKCHPLKWVKIPTFLVTEL